jgi:hypothetical protein
MLIDDATMQVSFLKDLVTMRDPASDFSFLRYLKQRYRLVDFINHKTLFPLRADLLCERRPDGLPVLILEALSIEAWAA